MAKKREQEKLDAEAKLVRTSPSIFKINPDIEFKHQYYFNDLESTQDVSYGQRNFFRNLDVVLK